MFHRPLATHLAHVDKQVFPDAKSSRTRSKISTYGSETRRPKGHATFCCDRKGKIHTIVFLEADALNVKPPLFSGTDTQAQDYLTIYADKTNAVEEETVQNAGSYTTRKANKDNIFQQPSNAFSPGRGKPLEDPIHTTLHPSVPPG